MDRRNSLNRPRPTIYRTPKGIRVVRVSPEWVETEASVALAERLAAHAGTDYEGGKQIIMEKPRRYPAGQAGETA